MMITVELLGVLRGRLGRDSIVKDVSGGMKLKELLKNLREEVPELKEAIEEDGSVTSSYVVFINGVDYYLLNGENYVLKDGDKVTLVPISHGG
ncbi:MAG: hypothetical protein B7O98_01375 [Zestosphaera tikiterensis]|uniref:Molybdopterin synthase sulfur carrier subunit n=1 Tax=Zestosphaera tikiterensis TaxID=1973259 RepID=A0A2R7Y6U8_9CREN|nr:MAG: hypothetical protein B7O98_01375 [Zestosphaera tikiterensis]